MSLDYSAGDDALHSVWYEASDPLAQPGAAESYNNVIAGVCWNQRVLGREEENSTVFLSVYYGDKDTFPRLPC